MPTEQMATKEDDFKQRFAAILSDLQQHGRDDPETLALIGSLAVSLVDKAGTRSWGELKKQLTRKAYDGLLEDFRTQGNALHQQGKRKHAYAIQVLAVSLVAHTQKSPEMAVGEQLMDQFVDATAAVFRKSRAPELAVN